MSGSWLSGSWTSCLLVRITGVMRWYGSGGSVCLGVASFAVAAFLGWGFTVDDALISTRVAHHLTTGGGYRFNLTGPVVDAVTPLGWAWMLAPLSVAGPIAGMELSRVFGLLCLLVSGGVIGCLAKRSPAVNREAQSVKGVFVLLELMPWIVAAACLPLGAWAVSGMETALVLLLCTLALLPGAPGLLATGLAMALRPELIPWGCALSVLRESNESPAKKLLRLLLVLALPFLVAVTRYSIFGSPAPLAVWAKPSDLASGLSYVWGGLRLLGIPILLVAGRGWRGLAALPRAAALAGGAHCIALVAAGGDWMSLFRLFTPILPCLVFAALKLNEGKGRGWAVPLRGAVGLGFCLLIQFQLGTSARGVWAQRLELVSGARSLLEGASNVGTLDVGWVGAAFPGVVTDFAGVTDPQVALLRGGHTSKRLPVDFLERREVDTLILLLAPSVTEAQLAQLGPGGEKQPEEGPLWFRLPFARQVEQHITRLRGAEQFVPVGSLPLRGTNQRYLLLRKLTARLVLERTGFGPSKRIAP